MAGEGDNTNTESQTEQERLRLAERQRAVAAQDKTSMDTIRDWYHRSNIWRQVSDAEVRSHMRDSAIAIDETAFSKIAAAEMATYSAEDRAANDAAKAAFNAQNPSTTTSTTTPPGTGYNLDKLKAAWLAHTGPRTAAALQTFLDANNKNGGFATGVTRTGSKLNQLAYNGQFIAKVIGSTDANPYLQWESNPGDTPPPPPGGTGATSAETPAQRAARLARFGLGPNGLQNQKPGEMPKQPTLGEMLGQQGPIANPGTYTPGDAYNAPDYMAPAPFAAPTAADMQQDPGYQFRLSEGQRALERSGAARGVTNTGGNMKGLLDYGQQAASQEYGNVYGRNLNTYNTNAQNAFQQYSTNAFKNNAYNQEKEGRRSGAFGVNSNLYQQQQSDAYNRAQKAYNDSMAAYQTKINNQRQYERDRMSDIQYAAGT